MDRQSYLQQPANLQLGRKLKIGVWVLTAAVWLLVGAMRRVKIPLPEGISFASLPLVYSILNSLVAVFLVVALIMIKRGNVRLHVRMIGAALSGSGLFLLLYVAYHFTTPETKFGGEGAIRVVYYSFLVTHIVLAALSLPFILMTWVYGYTNQFDKHRKMAKWVFPVWFYVAISGPACYLMLRPYY